MARQERVCRKVLRKVKKHFVAVTVTGGLVGGVINTQVVQAEEAVNKDTVVDTEQITPVTDEENKPEDTSSKVDQTDQQNEEAPSLNQEEQVSEPKTRAVEDTTTQETDSKTDTTDKAKKPYRRATILHTNDIHGRISYQGDSRYDMGFANIKTIADKYRELADEFIMIDAGDTIHGTNEVNLSRGKNAIDLLNKLGYKAFTPGNHEYNFGLDRLLELTGDEKNTFKTISSNVEYKDSGKKVFDSYTEWEVFGNKIGIIGVTAQDTPTTTHPDNVKDIRFTDEVTAMKGEIERLSDEFNHFIALTHVGYNVDEKIAKEVEGLDVIIGGHSHTPVIGGKVVNGTLITQAWEYGKMLGLVHLDFDEDGNLINKTAETITLDDNFALRDNRGKEENILNVLPSSTLGNTDDIKRETATEDPETKQMLDEFKNELDAKLDEQIGESAVDLEGTRDAVRRRETNLGNFIADAIRDFSKADIGVLNGGSIRSALEAGKLTVGDIITVLPFINTVETIELPGSVIKSALEHSVRLLPDEQNGGFLQMSGMSVVVDITKPVGERIVAVNVGDKPLDLDHIYSLTASDFTLAGGDGYDMFTKFDVANVSGELFSDAVMTYIKKQNKAISPKVEGRITIASESVTDEKLQELGFTRIGSTPKTDTETVEVEKTETDTTNVAKADDRLTEESSKTEKVIVDKVVAVENQEVKNNQHQTKDGEKLPDTATSTWVLGLLGMTSLLGGLGITRFKKDN